MDAQQIPIPVSKTRKGRASRGGTVEVLCTYCQTPFQRYVSQTVNKNGEHRKVFKCPACRTADPAKRFWLKVDKTSSAKGCWLWTASFNADGYPNFPYPEIGEYRGNRISWRLLKGAIPDDMYVLHKRECHDRKCVNPMHLYLGTQLDNMADAIAQGCKPVFRGEDQGASLLTDDAVREIRREYRRGNVRPLAIKFGVSIACIRDVHQRRSWRHVT